MSAVGEVLRPPNITERKKFPRWLERDSALSVGEKRSATRWYLYWFPGPRRATGQKLKSLELLSKHILTDAELQELQSTTAAMTGPVRRRGNRGRRDSSDGRT